MFGLTGREARFTVVISSTHLAQHVFIRLIPPLLPVLTVALAYPLWQLGLLISIYYIGSGLTQAPFGILSDRYDRLYLLPSGVAIAGGAYVLFAGAPILDPVLPTLVVPGFTFEGGYLVMCFSMLMVGLGTAVVHPVGYPMITANVRDEHKGKVLGAFGSSSKVGDGIAPAAVAVLILVMAWQDILLVLGIGGILFAVLLYLVLRSPDYETRPVQSADTTEVKNEGGEPERSNATERRSYLYPLVVLYSFFITNNFASTGVNSFLPTFLVGVYAYNMTIFGVYLGPESVANFYFAILLIFAAATQLVIGNLTDRYDARLILIGCVAVASVGIVVLAFFTLSPLPLLLVMLVLAAGLWGVNPARDALISDISPSDREGRTFGYLWTAVMLTGALIPTIVGYLMDTLGLREGLMTLVIGTLLAAVCISLLFSRRVYLPEPGSGPDTSPAD